MIRNTFLISITLTALFFGGVFDAHAQSVVDTYTSDNVGALVEGAVRADELNTACGGCGRYSATGGGNFDGSHYSVVWDNGEDGGGGTADGGPSASPSTPPPIMVSCNLNLNPSGPIDVGEDVTIRVDGTRIDFADFRRDEGDPNSLYRWNGSNWIRHTSGGDSTSNLAAGQYRFIHETRNDYYVYRCDTSGGTGCGMTPAWCPGYAPGGCGSRPTITYCSRNLTIASGPNMTISGSPAASYSAGVSINFPADVRNTAVGTSPSQTATNVRYRIDLDLGRDGTVDTPFARDVGTFAPGERRQYQVPWTTVAGNHAIRHCINPAGGTSVNTTTHCSAWKPFTVSGVVNPNVSLSVAPATVASGQVAQITWTPINATRCVASASPTNANWNGVVAHTNATHNRASSPLTANTTFTITCEGAPGTTPVTRSRTVNVAAAVIPAPEVNFSADPTAVASGGRTTLRWAPRNVTSCTASVVSGPANDNWNGAVAFTNTVHNRLSSPIIGPVGTSVTFRITCQGLPGSTPASIREDVMVTIGTPSLNPDVIFTAHPTVVASGERTNLRWHPTRATSCDAYASPANAAWDGAKAFSNVLHNQNSSPLTANTTFTITCTGASGATVSRSVTVQVGTAGTPVVDLSINRNRIVLGESATLTWSALNANSCDAQTIPDNVPQWRGTRTITSAVAGGDQVVTPTTLGSYQFLIHCHNSAGSRSAYVNLNVVGASDGCTPGDTRPHCSPPAPSAPSCTLNASPTAIASDGQFTLTWTTTNATSCTFTGDHSGSLPTLGSGSRTVGPLPPGPKSFGIDCTGLGGTSSCSAPSTRVLQPTDIWAVPALIRSGDDTEIRWTHDPTLSCVVSGPGVNQTVNNPPNPSNPSAGIGERDILDVTSERTYTIDCGVGGSDSVTIRVLPVVQET